MSFYRECHILIQKVILKKLRIFENGHLQNVQNGYIAKNFIIRNSQIMMGLHNAVFYYSWKMD